MSKTDKKPSKDVELLDKVFQWIGEKQESISERSGGLLRRLLPSRNRKVIDGYRSRVAAINDLESKIEALSHDQIKERVTAFRERLKDQEVKDQDKVLDEIQPEVFALVREASKRVMGMRHFDTQLIGGMVMHDGRIAEMATGEGKTLVATLPASLNALSGRGVFVVTVNDYLARRDRDWMAPVYEYLGLTVGAIQSSMDPHHRHPQYGCDITYGTNNEFGFDYLRDNMKSSVKQQVQRYLHFAIVDEVDSILIDEARTPLIISGMPEKSTQKYYLADGVSRRLKKELHFEIKEKEQAIILTEEGIEEAQKLVGVTSFYEGPHMDWPHHIESALKAHHIYQADKHYVKRRGEDGTPEIVIVDEFTGRMMPGRRWSDGLHQAVEAKEGIRIREENQTLATITFQNYFRLYHKLAGMTGTAITEAAEFSKIYDLDVVQVPTNRPNQRVDHEDVIYRGEIEKYPSIIAEIIEMRDAGRPTLIGTASIEKSELCSRFLTDPQLITKSLARRAALAEKDLPKIKKLPDDLREEIAELLKRPARMDTEHAEQLSERVQEAVPKDDFAFHMEQVRLLARAVKVINEGVPHNVLNAKYHEREADIVAQAGRAGAVTIATNMAGRGTDILLGGNPEFLARAKVKETGEAEKFEEYLAEFKKQCEREKAGVLEAGGLHVLGTERHEARRIDNQLRGRTARQGDPGSSRFYLSLEDDLMRIFAGERVQRILEFVGMKEGVQIEAPMVSRSIQRAQKKVEARNFDIRKNLLEYDEVMDKQRKTIYGLRQEILEGNDIRERIQEMLENEVERLADTYLGSDKESFDLEGLVDRFNQKFDLSLDAAQLASPERNDIIVAVRQQVFDHYVQREKDLTPEVMRQMERSLLLNLIDTKWKDHLLNIDALRSGIGLRSFGQIDPKNEFKKEGFRLFEEALGAISENVTDLIFKVRLVQRPEQAAVMEEGSATQPKPAAPAAAAAPQPTAAAATHPSMAAMAAQRRGMERAAASAGRQGPTGPLRRNQEKVGRNDACPCGSGKKYKKCCGQNA